jgi:hypothetical protein
MLKDIIHDACMNSSFVVYIVYMMCLWVYTGYYTVLLYIIFIYTDIYTIIIYYIMFARYCFIRSAREGLRYDIGYPSVDCYT